VLEFAVSLNKRPAHVYRSRWPVKLDFRKIILNHNTGPQPSPFSANQCAHRRRRRRGNDTRRRIGRKTGRFKRQGPDTCAQVERAVDSRGRDGLCHGRVAEQRALGRRPAAGDRMCADDEDVRKSIAWARGNDKPFAIRSGGHSYAGFSTTTGVLIDVKPMNGVRPLSGGVRSGRVVCALPDRIECAGHGDDPAADREAALPLNGQRRHACGLGGTRRYEECRRRDGAPSEDVQA